MQTDYYTQQTVLLQDSDFREPAVGETQSKLTDATVSFSTPIANDADLQLDIKSYLIKRPASTFFMKAGDDDLKRLGINRGDLLIIDRSRKPTNRSIIIATLDGELIIKQILMSQHTTYITPWSTRSTLLKINQDNDFEIWGVVAHSIHTL